MTPFLGAAAGSGPRITVKFKSKVFSFADVLVQGNALTLYQISEPLGTKNFGNFGTDINGQPVNDPLPDTTIGPATGQNVTTAGEAHRCCWTSSP